MAQMKTMGSGALGNSETRRIVSDVVNDATDGGNTGGMLSFLLWSVALNSDSRRVSCCYVGICSALQFIPLSGKTAHVLTVTMLPEAGRNALCPLLAPAPLMQPPATASSVSAAGLAALV